MDKISSYNITLTLEKLRNSFRQGQVPEELFDPLKVLLRRITEYTAEKPVSIYMFSDDGSAELRNLFGYALARSLMKHVPSTLLVDCEFLDVGMSGIVPQKDALGFLDLLLYGSSLGVIMQETSGGVHVVGAGSFPVTKRMPFVVSAFEEAARRLVGYSRCVIFMGPLHGDDGEIHPLAGEIDLPVFVRAADTLRAGIVDPIEEQIASQWDREILSVRISTSGRPAQAPEPSRETPLPREEVISLSEPEGPEVLQKGAEPVAPPDRERFEEIAPAGKRKPPAPPPVEKREPARHTAESPEAPIDAPTRDKRYTSLFPRIATWLVGIVIVVFLVWWVQQERTDGDTDKGVVQEETPTQTGPPPAQPQATDEQAALAAETGAEVPADTGQTAVQPPPLVTAPDTAASEPAETAADRTVRRDEPVRDTAVDTDDILVTDDLISRWEGQYLIHVSSFRGSTKAREESRYLAGRGFRPLIVYLDLGSKGKWYRVYVGPAETREEARELKIELDGTPGVRFTRITRVTGG